MLIVELDPYDILPEMICCQMDTVALKTRCVCYENSFKRKVILRAEESGNREAARHFSVPETCVQDW